MRDTIAFLVLMVGITLTCFSQADKVTGFWLTDKGEAQVKIYKGEDGNYYGKMVWLENPKDEKGLMKLDDKNPDEKLRSRTILNLVFLHKFVYDADDSQWNNGKIYDPESGNTYSAYIWFEDNNFNTLYLKGYIGFSLIGRTTKWIREANLRN